MLFGIVGKPNNLLAKDLQPFNISASFGILKQAGQLNRNGFQPILKNDTTKNIGFSQNE